MRSFKLAQQLRTAFDPFYRIACGIGAERSVPMLAFALRSKLLGIEASELAAIPTQPPTVVHAPLDLPNSRSTIPKIIFQTWKTRGDLPSNYKYWSATFRALNPDYLHVIWDDNDNRNFIVDNFAWFLPFYESYPKEIFRADIIRFFFLFAHGGLYADMDTECLKPLDKTLSQGRIILGRMGHDANHDHSIPNAMMASAPGQLFWLLAISMSIEKIRECKDNGTILGAQPEDLTGPVLLKKAFDYYTTASEAQVRQRAAWVLEQAGLRWNIDYDKITLLRPEAWYPVDWTNYVHRMFRHELLTKRAVLNATKARRLFPNSDLVTYWTHSW